MKIVFSIGNKNLSLITPSMSISVRATSGRNACMNTVINDCLTKSFEGPIPIGHYYIIPSEISDPNFVGDILRRTQGDWGDWRVRLHPKKGTQTYGRDNFFLHGGDMDGSAGCIDIGGGIFGNNKTDLILNKIQSAQVTISLEVIK